MTERSPPPSQLHELDAWLHARESAFADLRPDNEARIVWDQGQRQRRPLAVVYLHGFSASPMEVAPYCDHLAAALGAHLYYPRLSGHGRSAEAMATATEADWLHDARDALEIGLQLGEQVLLVGTSTGATLATLVAAEAQADRIAALILIAPNFGIADRRTFLLGLPGAKRWLHWLVGRERVAAPDNEAHSRFWTLRYATHTLIPMYALVQRLWRTVKPQDLKVPVLAVFSDADQVVDARQTRRYLARVPQVEIMAIEPNGEGRHHVVVGDAFGSDNTEAVLRRSLDFFRRQQRVARPRAS